MRMVMILLIIMVIIMIIIMIGLILPRKITNPCLQSTSVREVHREIRWNTNK